ncbi:hypothetical protein MM300_13085 [Evansella sp. LMS18]|nr:hypothetical protein [Evansella sp. LMS18]UTR08870.1 hypothetical protein MM300_13085 [Evansella sp. LMS18]
MGAPKVNQNEKQLEKKEAPLIGTWFSVGFVGVFILLTYILFFWIFMGRV